MIRMPEVISNIGQWSLGYQFQACLRTLGRSMAEKAWGFGGAAQAWLVKNAGRRHEDDGDWGGESGKKVDKATVLRRGKIRWNYREDTVKL
jgi:hypothetical protein